MQSLTPNGRTGKSYNLVVKVEHIPFAEIERKWQARWEAEGAFKAPINGFDVPLLQAPGKAGVIVSSFNGASTSSPGESAMGVRGDWIHFCSVMCCTRKLPTGSSRVFRSAILMPYD